MKNFNALLVQSGLDLLFPPRCLFCTSCLTEVHNHAEICPDCWNEIKFIRSPLCSCCGSPFPDAAGDDDHRCGACLKKSPAYSAARAVTVYGEVVKYLLHRLKYSGDTAVFPVLAQIVQQMDLELFEGSDLIIPVPLHKNRLRLRGLNQAIVLARLFFPHSYNKISYNLLKRIVDTIPQTTLDGEKRRKNLRGAFQAAASSQLKGRSICLVDDIFTTGTTVSECAKTLIRAGAKEVKVLTVARVV